MTLVKGSRRRTDQNARHASADERFDALFIGRQGGRIQGIFFTARRVCDAYYAEV